MKALSVQPFYATLISLGEKFIELRSWQTDYRGKLLICSSAPYNKAERESLVSGKAICVVDLVDVRPYNDKTDRNEAALFDDETFEGYSWILDNIQPIVPFPVKGQLRIYNVGIDYDELIFPEANWNNESYAEDIFQFWLDNGDIKNLSFLSPG